MEQIKQSVSEPICCVIGHVDVGKTLLLDTLRRSNVQKNEVGGITQQIGSTYFSRNTLDTLSGGLCKSLEIGGLLMIDTPGHDCFSQMRIIGIRMSHLAILVVDIVKGLEKQTLQCIEMLTQYNTPYVLVLNKLDRIYGWKACQSGKNLKNCFASQSKDVLRSMKDYSNKIVCQLAEMGVNGALYYENTSVKDFVSMVPISAKLGEGIPDLILLVSKLTTNHYKKVIKENGIYNYSHGYLLEVKTDDRHGLLHYTIMVNGKFSKGDTIKIQSTKGSVINATIKDILVPNDESELKNKSSLKIVDTVSGTRGIALKLVENMELSNVAIGGVVIVDDNENGVKMDRIIDKYSKTCTNEEFKFSDRGIIINVPAKGMADAFLEMMKLEENKLIKVIDINVGKINKTLLIRAATILNQHDKNSDDYLYHKRNAVILDYNTNYDSGIRNDLIYDTEINKMAKETNVTILYDGIIYKLIEKYRAFTKELNMSIKKRYPDIIPPVKLNILPQFIFLRNDPIMFGVKVVEGTIKAGVTLAAVHEGIEIKIGTLKCIQKKGKDVESATKNDEVCVRIEQEGDCKKVEYGRTFNEKYVLQNYVSSDDINIQRKYVEIQQKYPDVFIEDNKKKA
jgi:translation initiation factor 5B